MNKFKNYIFANYKPLLVSFFLALLLWIAVTTDKVYTMQVEVPFSITRLAPGKVLLEPPPSRIVLEVSGKGRALLGMSFYKGTINLDLPEIAKSTTILLRDYQKRLTIAHELGVRVFDVVAPKAIELKIDDYAKAKKPVKLLAQIKPQPGYILLKSKMTPDYVTVSGPKSYVKNIRFILTDTLVKKNIKYPFQQIVKLRTPRAGVIKIDPNTVLAEFTVEQIVERSIYNIPIQLIGIPPQYLAKAFPPNISVKIKGAESLVTALQPSRITAYFDFSRFYTEGVLEYPVEVETPQGIGLISKSPQQFRLQLQKREDF